MNLHPPLKSMWLDSLATLTRRWLLGWRVIGQFLVISLVLAGASALLRLVLRFGDLLPFSPAFILHPSSFLLFFPSPPLFP